MTVDEKLADLRSRGFKQGSGREGDDYVVQNDGDDYGPYIVAWLSTTPCPYPEIVGRRDAA